jgi:ankyrin repeat protein
VTPLIAAASAGRKSAVEVLLRAGADRQAAMSGGKTARALAEENGHAAIVALLAKA